MNMSEVLGRCRVEYAEDLVENVQDYSKRGPDCFYFLEVRMRVTRMTLKLCAQE